MKNPEFIRKLIENFDFDNIDDYEDDETVDTTLRDLSDAYIPVDLGLPSGLKWASMNIGAVEPGSLGLYFQYAGTQGVKFEDIPSEPTAPYLEGNETSGKWTKYNTEDKLNRLEPSDDAATINCGPYWRMPTMKEIRELCNNCYTEYINEQAYYEKHHERHAVMVCTSKTNGAKLIIPAGGITCPDYKFEDTDAIGFICSDRGPDQHGFSLGQMDVNIVEMKKTIWDSYMHTEYRQARRVNWSQVRAVSDKL